MKRRYRKSLLSTSDRTTFERQIFALCLKNNEYRKVIEKALEDFSFIYNETQMPFALFGQKYCEIMLQNKNILFDFQKIPNLLDVCESGYYPYRNDTVDKIYSMCLDANLI